MFGLTPRLLSVSAPGPGDRKSTPDASTGAGHRDVCSGLGVLGALSADMQEWERLHRESQPRAIPADFPPRTSGRLVNVR